MVYGGFNGQTKGDVIVFHPGQCGHVKEQEECVASYHGLKCVWNRKKELCEVWNQEVKKNSVELCSPQARNTTGVCRSNMSSRLTLTSVLSCTEENIVAFFFQNWQSGFKLLSQGPGELPQLSGHCAGLCMVQVLFTV